MEVDHWRAGERTSSTALAEPGDLVAWVEGVDPATGEVKGRIRSQGADRQPLRFVEVVVNNPKSLSIVASQNPAVADAVDRVLDRQADEIARYLSSVAVTRIGPRGQQREVAGLEVQTARVRHLTSREGDPHRHIHLMVNTRVRTPDGTWNGLYSAAIRQHIGAVHERAARVLVSDHNLREVLASEGYTLGTDGEIDQARGAVELLSKRATLVAANRERNEAAWRVAHPGREPSQRVRSGWDSQGWEQGRKRKGTEHESAGEMSQRIRLELASAGFDFTPGAKEPVSWEGVCVGQVDREAVTRDAIAGLSARKSAWSEAELTAQVDATLTASTVVGDQQAVGELAEDCRARARQRCVSLLDPEVTSSTAMSRHLSSEAVLASDMTLNLGLAELAGIEQTNNSQPTAGTHEGLDAGQAAALEAICGQRRLEVVIGPAGAGKTTMLAAAKKTLEHRGRDMVIVAPTRKAALVAGAEVGTEASSLSKLIYDHGFRWDDQDRWSRIAVGETDPQGRTHRGPAPKTTLSARSVIVVDEAALMTVSQANVLLEVCHESVGQLSSYDPSLSYLNGGMWQIGWINATWLGTGSPPNCGNWTAY